MPANPALDLMREASEKRWAALRAAKPIPVGAFIDPLNPYTGEVSVMAVMKNAQNGHICFPPGLGNTQEPA